MNNTTPEWNSLPNELLMRILKLASRQQSKIESCNVALVCKAWMETAQAVAYSNITIKTISHFEKFYDTITHNRLLGFKVRILDLQQIDTSELEKEERKVSYLLTTLLTTSLPNLEILEKDDLYSCVPTFHLLLNSRLRKLKRFTCSLSTENETEVANHVECAFLMIDRLAEVSILLCSYIDEKINIQYQRLYDSLYQFNNLVDVNLFMDTNNGISVLEYVVEACRSLECIMLFMIEREDKKWHIDSRSNEISRYIPRPNIDLLDVKMNRSDDHNLILYIMHKFPQLKYLSLRFEKDTPLIDVYLVTQLMEYVSKINNYSVFSLPVNKNGSLEMIGKHWKKTSKPGSENLYIDFDNSHFQTSVEFTKAIGERERSTKLMYPASEDFDWRSYMDFVEKYGKYIGTLRFQITVGDEPFSRSELPESFFPHILTSCPNLAHLQLYGCTLKQFDYSNVNLNKKFSINELRLFECRIQPGTLEELSVLLLKLDELSLYDNENFPPGNVNHDEDDVHLMIKMPYTDVDCIVFLSDKSNRVVYVKVLVASDETWDYYQIGLTQNRWIISTDEEAFAVEGHGEVVYISFPTKPNIDTRLLDIFETED